MGDRIFDTLVIGGGQTGLTVGYELARTGRTYLILDADDRVGDAWRKRWDSLLLFTPAGFFEIPGMEVPGPADRFVTKDETADLLEVYARDQGLPVLSGTRVTRLARDEETFVAETSRGSFRSRNVVVAMTNYQKPRVPAFANQLDPSIVQIHSSEYKNPTSLRDGPVLVVGMGNSGAEIGLELARDRETYVSGEPSAVIPFRIDTWMGRKVGIHIVRFLLTRVMTTSTPIGRKARQKMMGHAAPVVRAKPEDIVAAGAERVPRVTGVRGGLPELTDGRGLEVANVVWCTGFQPGFDWIDLPVFDQSGRPRQERGVSEDVPGLYFCGLFFQYAAWSETVTSMPRDARYVVEQLDKRSSTPFGTTSDRSTSVAHP